MQKEGVTAHVEHRESQVVEGGVLRLFACLRLESCAHSWPP